MIFNVGDSIVFRGIECIIFYDAGSEQSWGRYIVCQKNDLNYYYSEVGTGGVEEAYQGLAWGPDEVTGITDTALGTGKANTDSLIQKYGTNTSYFWYYVQQMRTKTGYDGWMVPSKDEATQMFLHRDEIGNFTVNTDGARFYWSSSENDSFSAWRESMLNGGWGADGKPALDRRVRLCAFASEKDLESHIGETITLDGIECLIFYDAGSEQSWGRYLAIDKNHDHSFYTTVDKTDHLDAWLPVANPYSYGYEWGGRGSLAGVSNEIGSGMNNTNLMIEKDPDYVNGNWRTLRRETTAFRNRYSEKWFVPSQLEFVEALKYKNLLQNLSYNISNIYWTSSETDATSACAYRLTATSQNAESVGKDSNSVRDRLCRVISEKEINPLIVTLNNATEDSEIRYTTDGVDPSQTSNLYSAPFEFTGSTLKARAFKNGILPSDIYVLNRTMPDIQATVAFISDEVVNNQHQYTFRCVVNNASAFPSDTMFRIRAFDTSGEFINILDGTGSTTNPLYTESKGQATILAKWTTSLAPSSYGIIQIEAESLGLPKKTWSTQFPVVSQVTAPLINFTGPTNSVSITAYNGSTAYYKLNFDTEWIQYTGSFAITGDTTVYAYANRTGYLQSSQVQDSFKYIPTPVISYANNTVTISLTNYWDSEIYYGINTTSTWTKYSGPFAITYSATIYARCSRGGLVGPQTSQYCTYVMPKLQTPTLSLSRSGTTVNGSIGNIVSGATYRYRTGSAPTSSSSGTLISGSTFSFTNSNAVTVYVRGFMSGYQMSDAVSQSVSAYVQPTCATPVISQSGNTVTITCSTPGATIHYRKSSTSTYSTGSSPVTITLTATTTYYAYATASGYKQSSTTSKSCTYTAPKLPTPRYWESYPGTGGFALTSATGFPENPEITDTFTLVVLLDVNSLVSGTTITITANGKSATLIAQPENGHAAWEAEIPGVFAAIDGIYNITCRASGSGYTASDTGSWDARRLFQISYGLSSAGTKLTPQVQAVSNDKIFPTFNSYSICYRNSSHAPYSEATSDELTKFTSSGEILQKTEAIDGSNWGCIQMYFKASANFYYFSDSPFTFTVNNGVPTAPVTRCWGVDYGNDQAIRVVLCNTHDYYTFIEKGTIQDSLVNHSDGSQDFDVNSSMQFRTGTYLEADWMELLGWGDTEAIDYQLYTSTDQSIYSTISRETLDSAVDGAMTTGISDFPNVTFEWVYCSGMVGIRAVPASGESLPASTYLKTLWTGDKIDRTNENLTAIYNGYAFFLAPEVDISDIPGAVSILSGTTVSLELLCNNYHPVQYTFTFKESNYGGDISS